MTLKHSAFLSVAAAMSLAIGGQIAQAGPVDPFIVSGTNVVEDDSAEQVFRCNLTAEAANPAANNCMRLARGSAISPASFVGANGDTFADIFAGVLQFPTVNGTNLGSTAELTGLFVARLDGSPAAGIITESPVGRDIFLELTGVDLSLLTYDVGTAADTMAVLYQDSGNALNTQINANPASFALSLAEATDGMLAGIVGRLGNDFFEASIASPGGSGACAASGTVNALTVGGCTAAGTNASLFDLTFGLSFQSYRLSGEIIQDAVVAVQPSVFPTQTMHDLSGSGIHRAPDAPAVGFDIAAFDLANDIEAAFAVRTPEPASLALLGLGLLGVSAVTRRRRGR